MGRWLVSAMCSLVVCVGCAAPEPAQRELDPGARETDAQEVDEPTDPAGGTGGLAPPPTAQAPDRGIPEEAPPPAASDVVWIGAVATTPTVDFGGAPYCKYRVTFSDVVVKITLDPSGNVKSSSVTGKMTETAVAPCAHAPIAAHAQSYTYVAPEPKPSLELVLAAASTNKPRAEAQVTGTPGAADTMKAKVRFHRVDLGAPFDWTVTSSVSLTRQLTTE